ncbi:MAG: ABC transporter substrate-binding protein, partial [Chloroflexi bacterium]|nr:ABC transporter substrate-binding protein [Chloroflexota bacterium]
MPPPDRRSASIVRAAASCALLVTAACLIFGCASSSDHARGRTHDATTVLNFWNGFTGPDGITMQKMVSQFESDNPDIQVKMQLIPWTTYYDKLTLSLAYGGAPDVFVVHAMRVPEFASFHTLRPLETLLPSTKPPLTRAQFVPVAWQASFYHGRQVALPLDVHAMGLYYNTRLFKEAGIVDSHGDALPPVTWSEFLADAKKLTRDTKGNGRIDQWGFVFTNQHTNWFTFADQFGGGVLSPDGKTCILQSPQNIQALTVMRDLIYKYRVTPKPEGVDAWLAFQQGKAAMAMEGIYMLESLQEQKGLEFSGAPVPHFGPIQSVWTGSHML